jgi:hypothetical protein
VIQSTEVVSSGWKKFKWARPTETFTNKSYAVWKNIDPSDMTQGELGTCYLLSALSSLAEIPGLIHRLFEFDKINEQHILSVWLNINGLWKEIVLDEFVPMITQGKGLEFAFSKAIEDELWVSMIEKAYAKAYGSYQRIDGGVTYEALRDLTGAPYEIFSKEALSNIDLIWSKLREADHKDYIVCASTKATSIREEVLPNGLISGHAYSIIKSKQIVTSSGKESRIMMIRNPWGKVEWNGDWSDKSDRWSDALLKALGHTIANDGIFWITVEDFCENFCDLAICKVNGHYYYNAIEIQGSMTEKVTYSMTLMLVETAGDYSISADQQDGRTLYPTHKQVHTNHCDSTVRFTIGRIENNHIEHIGCVYGNRRNMHGEFTLKKGRYCILSEMYWTQSYLRSYVISAYGPDLVCLKQVDQTKQEYDSISYLQWRDFAHRHPLQFTLAKTNDFKSGDLKVKVRKETCDKSAEYGLELNKYSISEGKAEVQFSFEASNVQGYEIISQRNEGNKHTYILTNDHCEVDILRHVANSHDAELTFDSSSKAPKLRPLDQATPEDVSIVDRLENLPMSIPHCEIPFKDMDQNRLDLPHGHALKEAQKTIIQQATGIATKQEIKQIDINNYLDNFQVTKHSETQVVAEKVLGRKRSIEIIDSVEHSEVERSTVHVKEPPKHQAQNQSVGQPQQPTQHQPQQQHQQKSLPQVQHNPKESANHVPEKPHVTKTVEDAKATGMLRKLIQADISKPTKRDGPARPVEAIKISEPKAELPQKGGEKIISEKVTVTQGKDGETITTTVQEIKTEDGKTKIVTRIKTSKGGSHKTPKLVPSTIKPAAQAQRFQSPPARLIHGSQKIPEPTLPSKKPAVPSAARK